MPDPMAFIIVEWSGVMLSLPRRFILFDPPWAPVGHKTGHSQRCRRNSAITWYINALLLSWAPRGLASRWRYSEKVGYVLYTTLKKNETGGFGKHQKNQVLRRLQCRRAVIAVSITYCRQCIMH